MLIPECGKYEISYENALRCMDVHGKLVGVIHAIAPYEYVDDAGATRKSVEHQTQLFYSKGYVHVSDGFALGYTDGLREEKGYRVFTFSAIIFTMITIISMFDEEYFLNLGLEKVTDKTKYFIFRPNQSLIPENIKLSKGYQAFQKALDIMTLQGENMFYAGEQNEDQS